MKTRIDVALSTALSRAEEGAPPTLARALRHGVFPGGARVRPQLCLAVAAACGMDAPLLAEAMACSIELVHCASLVHDDLPCFDDADLRRGRPSVHRAFGEPLAVLVGDALIVLAFEALARAGAEAPQRLSALTILLARSVGSQSGLIAGQAWESEASVPLDGYHQAKTGSLFVAATTGGAVAAGKDPGPWRAMGDRLGAAYQVADDLLDAVATSEEAGKPVRQDRSLGRPNAVSLLGLHGAVGRLRGYIDQAAEAVPPCPGDEGLRALVREMAERLVPTSLRQSAA